MSKEHAYAYEAGYIDGSTHYELEHCPACKNIADLQEALAENAKLRELVRDMVLLAGVNGCDVTSMQLHLHDGDWRTIADRMREQVVRCRDCESYREHVNGCVEFGRMEYEEYAIVEPDGFCAWGKRRESE